ncbi:MAG: hypothetical protein NTX81_02045 [Candidatus Bathyarchaeota archaeon]|nr:hypothetical protein [Candidatus Bathyarchaeota archaeon]
MSRGGIVSGASGIDGKQGIDVSLVLDHFKFQPNPNSCYTNCIYNILQDLSRTHNSTTIRLSESKINRICQNKGDLGPRLAVVVRNLNGEIRRLGYIAQESFRVSYDRMGRVLADKESSYPIIGLFYSYLLDRGAVEPLDDDSIEPPDHAVIVLSSNDSETMIFDPYAGISRKMQQQSNQQGLPKGAYIVPTPRILQYWEKASFSSWMFWVSRSLPSTNESIISTQLDSYSK